MSLPAHDPRAEQLTAPRQARATPAYQEQYGPIRAVFLDAGLTLIYSDLPLAERISAIASERGIPLSPQAVAAAMPLAQAGLFKAHRDDPDLWSFDDRVHQLWLDFYRSALHYTGIDGASLLAGHCADALYAEFNAPGAWKLYQDVLPTLEALHHEGYIIGVISDWSSNLPAGVLLPLGIGSYVNFMVVSTIVRHAKPGQDLYREALARAGAAPHEAVHVGDNYINDILGARGAGIRGIFLDRDNRHTAPLDCPRITTLAELPHLLARLSEVR